MIPQMLLEDDGVLNMTCIYRLQGRAHHSTVGLQVRVITYFSLYSVYVQCTSFAKLTFYALKRMTAGLQGRMFVIGGKSSETDFFADMWYRDYKVRFIW